MHLSKPNPNYGKKISKKEIKQNSHTTIKSSGQIATNPGTTKYHGNTSSESQPSSSTSTGEPTASAKTMVSQKHTSTHNDYNIPIIPL